MKEPKSLVFNFGEFEVRESDFLLMKAGRALAVEPKVFRLLLFLLHNARRLVTKQEIIDAVWKDTSVSDNSLTKSIATLRRLLDDDPQEPKYIATVQTVGYRFVCDVTIAEDVAQSAAPRAAPQEQTHSQQAASRTFMKPAAVGLALIFAMFLAWFVSNHPDTFWKPLNFAHRGDSSNKPTGASTRGRRLTANPEDTPITSAAISPDGKYLAYSDSVGFFLKVVDSEETHAVPLPAGFTPEVESWFPDSVHLVVSWIEDTRKPPGLWVISVLGGTPRKLADVGSFARVSPDGSQVAFLRGPWDDNEIWLADSEGNSPRKILDGGADGFGPVSWSPDGRRFASIRSSVERQDGQIQIYDLTAGRLETVLTLRGLGSDIAWSRSGLLYYSLAEAPPHQDATNLWSVELDNTTGRPTGSAIRITDDRDRVGSLTETNDSRHLAALRYSYQSDVFLTTIDPMRKRLSPLHRFTLDQRDDFPSSWTPDSNAVLIVSNRDGVNHVFKRKLAQTQPEIFVGGKQDVWLPHMNPEGKEMLYLASPEHVGPSDGVRLMSIPLAGGSSRLIFEEPGLVNYQCARLPSRTCVYGKVDAEDYRFFSFDPANGNRKQLSVKLKKGFMMNNWNLSPDGRFLAISESQDPYSGPRLRVISLVDNRERLLSLNKLNLIIGVDWAADSKSIWVGGFIGRGFACRSGVVNVDMKGHQIVAMETRSPTILGATPSPNGRHLALGTNSYSSNVWLLQIP